MSSPLSLSDRLAVVPGYCEVIGLGQLGYYLGRYIKHVVWDRSGTGNAEDLAGMRKGFLHAIPVVGEVYAFFSCYKKHEFPTQSELAILPIVQQVLGVGTFLWHAGILTMINPAKKALYWSTDHETYVKLKQQNSQSKPVKTMDWLKQMNWKEHFVGCGKGILWTIPGAWTTWYMGEQIGDAFAMEREAYTQQLKKEIKKIRKENDSLKP